MRRLLCLLLVALLVGALSPSAVLAAKQSPPRSTGEMTGARDGYLYGYNYTDLDFTWRWNATGASGAKSAKGTVDYTVTYTGEDGKVEVVDSRRFNVTDVVRVSENTVDIYTDTVYGPEPAWPEQPFRVIDNGNAGDQLQLHCYICEIFHTIAVEGKARVW